MSGTGDSTIARATRSSLKAHRSSSDPPPVIQLNELADSSVNFICRPWTRTVDYWTVYWDITRAVKEQFDRNGISIPFPQRDIHVFQETVPISGREANGESPEPPMIRGR